METKEIIEVRICCGYNLERYNLASQRYGWRDVQSRGNTLKTLIPSQYRKILMASVNCRR